MAVATSLGMANFQESVVLFMSSPVYTIEESATLASAQDLMRSKGITSLAVISDRGDCAGAISQTDLLRIGQRNAGSDQKAELLEFGNIKVSEAMTEGAISVDSSTTMSAAAAKMLEEQVHRVFVTSNNEIIGVLSTRDVMAAVENVKFAHPVSKYMSSPVFTVRASEPLSLATERLAKAHVSGVVVVDDAGWPVGIFGQEEALDASKKPRSTSVESAMNACILSLPEQSLMHNVARQALATRARRVAIMNRHEVVGVMTGIDFARAIS